MHVSELAEALELAEVEANIRQATATAKERIDATLANGDTFEDRFAGVRGGAGRPRREPSLRFVRTRATSGLARAHARNTLRTTRNAPRAPPGRRQEAPQQRDDDEGSS